MGKTPEEKGIATYLLYLFYRPYRHWATPWEKLLRKKELRHIFSHLKRFPQRFHPVVVGKTPEEKGIATMPSLVPQKLGRSFSSEWEKLLRKKELRRGYIVGFNEQALERTFLNMWEKLLRKKELRLIPFHSYRSPFNPIMRRVVEWEKLLRKKELRHNIM